MKFMKYLGVNVDHVATIREARHTIYPSPLLSARAAIAGGADQITIHLREDRRHIQDYDLSLFKKEINVPLNLEMAASEEIVKIACNIGPNTATLVPERRMELTTEGGLDVVANYKKLFPVVEQLKNAGISVSMFIDPQIDQIEASIKLQVDAVEFHTGSYCDAENDSEKSHQMEKLVVAVRHVTTKPLRICAGHGLNYDNIREVVQKLPEITEYNIGHSIVARSIFVGMENAVREMKGLLS